MFSTSIIKNKLFLVGMIYRLKQDHTNSIPRSCSWSWVQVMSAPVQFGAKRHGYIDSLIYWRDPKTSAAVLAAGLAFFALTIVFRYSYTALLCMFFLVHLLVSVSTTSLCMLLKFPGVRLQTIHGTSLAGNI